MIAVSMMPRDSRDWTVEDLELLPDDGLQYELFDGVLLVSPPRSWIHQRALGRLHRLLHAAFPVTGMEVFVGPLDWQPDQRNSLQPDLLVVRDEDVESKNIRKPLVVAVEVVDLWTRRKDLVLKRSTYEDFGIPSYWVIDPDEPSIVVYELRDGHYWEYGRASGVETLAIERPYPLSVTPSALVER